MVAPTATAHSLHTRTFQDEAVSLDELRGDVAVREEQVEDLAPRHLAVPLPAGVSTVAIALDDRVDDRAVATKRRAGPLPDDDVRRGQRPELFERLLGAVGDATRRQANWRCLAWRAKTAGRKI